MFSFEYLMFVLASYQITQSIYNGDIIMMKNVDSTHLSLFVKLYWNSKKTINYVQE
jgi:hypothetical protein